MTGPGRPSSPGPQGPRPSHWRLAPEAEPGRSCGLRPATAPSRSAPGGRGRGCSAGAACRLRPPRRSARLGAQQWSGHRHRRCRCRPRRGSAPPRRARRRSCQRPRQRPRRRPSPCSAGPGWSPPWQPFPARIRIQTAPCGGPVQSWR
ncbi:hypothetical protein ACFFX0_27500 [Citricoccus parietis]|uniref:Uncharacterized protein n=1 Tax=Citricoccus parietis TaxID=592307 RepID=A0ABV5G6Z4_9MICC